jgi:hypothetical protein
MSPRIRDDIESQGARPVPRQIDIHVWAIITIVVGIVGALGVWLFIH